MVWSVFDIYESDFGCEERMPGEPLMVMVELTCEDGRMCQLEVPDNYLLTQGIDVGDEWPFDLDEEDSEAIKSTKMAEWMDNYYEAIEEMEEQDE